MKSILITTEQFTIGGLETRVVGEVSSLTHAGIEVHLAVGAQFSDALLSDSMASVTRDLAFGPQSSASELVDTVEKLRQIIRQHSVDLIHAHPFTSLIPSFIAAELEGVPLALTLHGPASLASYYGPIYDFILKSIILPNSRLVIAVSTEVEKIAARYVAPEALLVVPNSVNFNGVRAAVDEPEEIDSRWLVVSRLDPFKVVGIADFIVKAKAAGMPGILLVGDGPAKAQLKQTLEENGLIGFVEFYGASANVQGLMQKSAGIAGMGRVVLEGIASGKPVVLVGYDGVKGVVDKTLLKLAEEANFSGRGLRTIDASSFCEQIKWLKDIDLTGIYNVARDRFQEGALESEFLKRARELPTQKPTILSDFYRSVVSDGINDTLPFLQSAAVLERLGELICSVNYFDQRLAASFFFCRQSLSDLSLRQTVKEREGEIASLTQTLADRGEQIASLTKVIANRDQKISEIKAELIVALNQYRNVMESNSMQLTSFARSLRFKLTRAVCLIDTFLSIAKSHGIRHAISKVKTWLKKQEAERLRSVQDLTLTKQECYEMEKSAQNGYLTNYIANGLETIHFDFIHNSFPSEVLNADKLVIYPLSYPMELTQRPDHILRNFAENGYQCIIVVIDSNDSFVRTIGPNVYLTNLYAGVISYFSNKNVAFYITFPFYSYILNHLNRPIVIYDVLDDLTVFAGHCETMKSDHVALLVRADVTLFSSHELFNKNHTDVQGEACLVTNGVWVNDFEIDTVPPDKEINFKKDSNEYVIGYHGAISELLDWELLERLLEIPKVRLVLIGPIASFDNIAATNSLAISTRVLASSQVTHIQPVTYLELKYYLRGFDAALVPFVVNEKTHPVSPLKLFEYMAMGLKVFATPTKTLSRYDEFITVCDRDTLPSIIRKVIDGHQHFLDEPNYSKVLSEVDWGKQLAEVVSIVDEKIADSENATCGTRTVDIVNINFFDWDGVTAYKGGAERYVYDLACLLKDDGWSPRILQNANKPFKMDFHGIPVVGIQTGNGYDLRGMSKKYREICSNSDLIIASPADLACELWGLKVIGINHGIYWDHKSKKLETSNINEYKNIFDALKTSSSVVAVDTNFINWVRTYDYALGGKLTYVPNYFEGKDFFPTQKCFEGKIRILYPRRLYEARGIFITLKAFDYLFNRHEEIELHLVGQANPEDGKIVSEFIEKHTGRVIWEELDMEDMYKAYQTSHITLVPTMFSEGTSLSCIEAMATNNAIIATNIGGLPNLIIDGFNGFLVNPTVEALIQSIESLLADRSLMQSMAAKGIELAGSFEKNRWNRRWRNIIAEVTNEKNSLRSRHPSRSHQNGTCNIGIEKRAMG